MKKLITSALPYVNNVPHLGNIIGCAMELAEKELIEQPLSFGQADKLLDLIRALG